MKKDSRVKQIAEEKGISQEEVQRKTDLSNKTIHLIFRDSYKEITAFRKIAKVLKVLPEQLLEDVEQNKPEE